MRTPARGLLYWLRMTFTSVMPSDNGPVWPGETIIRLTYGHMVAQALHIATVLGVFDVLESGPKMTDEIADSLSAQPGALGRLLRLLVSADVLAASRPDTYALAPAGATLISSAPDSLRSRVLMRFDDASWRAWGELLHAVRSGEPSHPKVTGSTGFGYLARHPELQATFHAAMSAMTGRVAASFAAAQDLSGARVIAD